MAGPAAVEIEGLKDFRKELKALGPEWPKALRKQYKTISDHVAQRAAAKASSLGGVHAKAAPKIKGHATASEASVGVPSGGAASVGVWGAKRHTGWYAKPQYADSPPQHPKWVGNSWEPGVAGQGPYAINSAIAAELPFIEQAFGAAIDDVTARAFPDR
jgi:hypothetical protein